MDDDERPRDDQGRFLPAEEGGSDEPASGEPSASSEESSDSSGEPSDSGSSGRQDISGTTAPSIGPNTTIEREDPKERLARHEQSDIDAMGLEKRREVVGGNYGASFARQATLYGGVLAVIAAIVIGFIVLAGQLDKPPETIDPQAPWATEPHAPQTPVQPIE